MQGSFMRQLKSLDSKLDCYQSGDGFNVTYRRGNGTRVNIMRIDGRQPDNRDLNRIRASDIRREDPVRKNKRVAEYMRNEREKDHKQSKSMIKEQTIDNKNQLMNVFSKAAGFKGNSAFRRINPKTKGKVLQ